MAYRELRLAFAMGGGVSLGAFSGAALTQAIKLLIAEAALSANPRNRYDRVVIDAFSGASAGAVSLAIMLRGLLHQSTDQRSQADAALRADPQIAPHLDRLVSHPLLDALRAAQHAQNMQQQVWTRDLHLRHLLGEPGRMARAKGLFDLEFLKQIAERYADIPSEARTWNRSLLADRALFCCTLTNLTPICLDARDPAVRSSSAYLGLSDASRSFEHADLRVFDLRLGSPVRSARELDDPERWFRLHLDDERDGLVGDLRQRRSWRKIFLSAAACGAFPLAFAPVVLKRHWWEFGRHRWPIALGGGPGMDVPHTPTFAFSYIDGGVFNNEPVREAFRLASFLDARYPTHRPDGTPIEYARRVLFVDPFVSDEAVSLELPIHRDYRFRTAESRHDDSAIRVESVGTLDRLLPHAPTLLGMLRREAAVREPHRVAQTRDTFIERGVLRAMLEPMLAQSADPSSLEALLTMICSRLHRDREHASIPPGRLSLRGELLRVAREEPTLASLVSPLDSWPEDGIGPISPDDTGRWLRAATFVAIDLMLDLEGKSQRAELTAIAPFHKLRRDRAQHVVADPIDLPAGAMSGFAGFLSASAASHAFDAGLCAAMEFLSFDRLCTLAVVPTPSLAIAADRRATIDREIATGMEQLAERLKRLTRGASVLRISPWVDWMLSRGLSAIVERVVRRAVPKPGSRTMRIELRLRVDGPDYLLQPVAVGGRGVRPVVVENAGVPEHLLLSYLDHDPTAPVGHRWSGPFVHDGRIRVDRRFQRPPHCLLALPSETLLSSLQRVSHAVLFNVVPRERLERVLPPESWIVRSSLEVDA